MDVSTGGGKIEINGTERYSLPYYGVFQSNNVVMVRAIPSFGYVFNGWEGHITSQDNPEFIVIDCSKRITASFIVDWGQISLVIGGIILVILVIAVLFVRPRSPETVIEGYTS